MMYTHVQLQIYYTDTDIDRQTDTRKHEHKYTYTHYTNTSMTHMAPTNTLTNNHTFQSMSENRGSLFMILMYSLILGPFDADNVPLIPNQPTQR